MSEAVFRDLADSPALTSSAVPTAAFDRTFQFRAVNPAYEQVALQSREMLLGQAVFTAFPDNPTDPAGAGSTRLASSFELVLGRRQRHHLGFLRYDIPDSDQPDVYLRRVWSAASSPILEAGRAVGVLLQVEDVTVLLHDPGTDLLRDRDEPTTHLAAALAGVTVTLAALGYDNNQLRDALSGSRTIRVAVGILMTRHNLTHEAALTLLRLRSQDSNRDLRDIAEQLIDTDGLP